MIKVVSYIRTLGHERFKEFIDKPFSIDMLFPVFDDKSGNLLFHGWKGKDMLNWYKFINDDNIILEFYPEETYIIKKNTKSYQLTTPKTINEFIGDMERLGIQLYWSKWIDENFEPKEYLPAEEIKNYYFNLLSKMGKSHELL